MNRPVETRVADDHIYHRSADGEPLENQPNATFGHRTDWWHHCRFCWDVVDSQRRAAA